MTRILFNVFANGIWGPEGLSGGDEIFINFAKKLKTKTFVSVFTWEDGLGLCKNNGLDGVSFQLIKTSRFRKFRFFGLYFIRTFLAFKKAKEFFSKVDFNKNKVIIYSASDFYPDFFPALLIKWLYPQVKWVAGFYLFCPNPLKGFRKANEKEWGMPKLKDLFYWLSQKPVFWLMVKHADLICVTSQPEMKPFIRAGKKRKDLFIVKGGIDYQTFVAFQKKVEKKYDAVFVGRFHPQKGVVEMINIWRLVVEKNPKARLAIIGVGEMEAEMRKKIKTHRLLKNVDFLGIKLGNERNKILQRSKIILHPAVYDSGGMAAAAGLACGLPGVSFDLPVFKTYYPNGFLRVKLGDHQAFAEKILLLLNNNRLYFKMNKQAIKEAKSWDWDGRVKLFWEKINQR